MQNKGHSPIKNRAIASGTADRVNGRDSDDSDSRIDDRGQIGAESGQTRAPGDGSDAQADRRRGQVRTDGGPTVADRSANTDTNTALADAVGYIISSRYRIKTIASLDGGPATPSTIATEQDIDIAHVSRALQKLRERDLVDLVVAEDTQKGRLYALTDRGERLLDQYGETIERNGGSD